MHFFFAGGDAEMSSLRLCLSGDVGGTGISFLLLWGGVGGIGERIGKECCGSCPGGVDGIGERIGKECCGSCLGGVDDIGERSVEESSGSCPGGVSSSSTHWSGSRPHDK